MSILCSEELQKLLDRLNIVLNELYRNSESVKEIKLSQRCTRFDPMEDDEYHNPYLNMQVVITVQTHHKKHTESRVILNDTISIADKQRKQQNVDDLGERMYMHLLEKMLSEDFYYSRVIEDLSKKDRMHS
jgi:hypothetical protein